MTGARVQTRGARDGTEEGNLSKHKPQSREDRQSWRREARDILNQPPASVVELPIVPAVKPPRRIIRNEEIEMNNKSAPAKNEQPLYCPACIGEQANVRSKDTDPVCSECNQAFFRDQAASLVKGKLITIHDWIVTRATLHLSMLEPKQILAAAELKKIENDVTNETTAAINKTIGNAEVAPEVRRQAFGLKRRELWMAKGGNAKFARMKEMERKIALLKEAIHANITIIKKAEPAPATEMQTEPAATTPDATAAPSESIPTTTS